MWTPSQIPGSGNVKEHIRITVWYLNMAEVFKIHPWESLHNFSAMCMSGASRYGTGFIDIGIQKMCGNCFGRVFHNSQVIDRIGIFGKLFFFNFSRFIHPVDISNSSFLIYASDNVVREPTSWFCPKHCIKRRRLFCYTPPELYLTSSFLVA